MTVNYIDPGTTKGCAVAAFAPQALGAPGLVGLAFWTPMNGFERTWGHVGNGRSVWEMPQLYPPRGGTRRRGETPSAMLGRMVAQGNALIALSACGSACATYLGWGRGGTEHRLPRQWKGQLAKPVTHAAALRVLSARELRLLSEAYADTSRTQDEPLHALLDYVRAGQDYVASNPGRELKGYGAKITDLLDAVTFGLSEEGRLRLT